MKNKQLQDYDIVKFKDDVKRQLEGYRIGKWLIVARRIEGVGYKIYRTDGITVINSIFVSVYDALEFAEWLDEKFGEYFPLWEEYPDIDLFGLVKWTIDDGLRLYETLKELNEEVSKIETLKAVNDAYYRVEEDAKQWNGLG